MTLFNDISKGYHILSSHIEQNVIYVIWHSGFVLISIPHYTKCHNAIVSMGLFPKYSKLYKKLLSPGALQHVLVLIQHGNKGHLMHCRSPTYIIMIRKWIPNVVVKYSQNIIMS